MNFFLYLTSLLFFLFIFIAVKATIDKKQGIVDRRVKMLLSKRLPDEDQTDATEEEEHEKESNAFTERVLKPAWNALKVKLFSKMPKETKKELEQKITEAGNPYQLTPLDVQLAKVVLGSLFFVLILILFLRESEQPGKIIFFAIVAGGFGAFYPTLFLKSKTKERMKSLQKGMPDFFDMVNVSIEAGMGLDAALSKVAKQMKGPLAEEFLQTIDEMRLGKTRRQAFSELRDRIPLEGFKSVMSALIQADQLGLGMSKVLRAQTQRIREQRRQLAKEQAMKAPVKMMIPMVLFIFPTLFVVLLGPIVVKAITEWF